MGKYSPTVFRPNIIGFGASLLVALLLIFIVVHSLVASPLAANLDGSSKTVSRDQAFPGQTLQYTVVISNSGDTAAQNVTMTDTLPVELTYQTDSLTYTVDSAVATNFGENNGVITWTGVVSDQGSVALTFQAVLTDSLTAGEEVQNSVHITGASGLVTKTASTTVITSTEMFFPIFFKAVPVPFLNPITRMSSANEWTASWNDVDPDVAYYEIQEDSDASFSSPTTFNVGTDLSRSFNPPESTNTLYCYRVRANANGVFSGWSNTRCVYGNYLDYFRSSSSGWSIRRQDTDDANNSSYYQNGAFVIKIGGRWDYAIAAPMVPAPSSSYKIETLVKLSDGIDNLHTYGVVFGGDWNGTTCPNSSYSSCFNHYYRLQVIWFGDPNQLRIDLKRIDFHDEDNVGRGTKKLIETKNVNVGNPSGWNKWSIEVYSNGTIRVYVNDIYVGGGIDTTYTNDRYFGGFAASNEYSGTAANFDYFRVIALP